MQIIFAVKAMIKLQVYTKIARLAWLIFTKSSLKQNICKLTGWLGLGIIYVKDDNLLEQRGCKNKKSSTR